MAELKVSNGLYGNALVNTSDPFIITSIIESDFKFFNKIFDSNSQMLMEAKDGKGSFVEKVKAFIKKIKEFIKKIWEKIVKFFKMFKDKLTKARKDIIENNNSDEENSNTTSTTQRVFKIKDYISWAMGACHIRHPMIYQPVSRPEDVASLLKTVIFGCNTGKNTKEEMFELVDIEMEQFTDKLIDAVNKGVFDNVVNVKTYSHGMIDPKIEIKDGKTSDIPTEVSKKFNEIFDYIKSNPIEFSTTIDKDGKIDFEKPIRLPEIDLTSSSLSEENLDKIFKDFDKLTDNIVAGIHMRNDTLVAAIDAFEPTKYLSMVNEDKEDLYDSVFYYYLNNLAEVNIAAEKTNTIMQTNLCKMINRAISTLTFLRKVLKT